MTDMPKKFLLIGFVFLQTLLFSYTPLYSARSSGAHLPEVMTLSYESIQHSHENPEGQFEYKITLTAHINVKNVKAGLNHAPAIELNEEPYSFEGPLKKGEVQTWSISGKVNAISEDEENPSLAAWVHFEYPYKEVQVFLKQAGSSWPLRQKDALGRALEQKKDREEKIIQSWPA